MAYIPPKVRLQGYPESNSEVEILINYMSKQAWKIELAELQVLASLNLYSKNLESYLNYCPSYPMY